jgi:hypothetical protein
MRNIELSKHAKDMMHERNILEKWVWRTIDTPDRVKIGDDNNTHYIKAISEHGGRFLRVIVNHHVVPKRLVTLFFDRRLGRQK